MASTNFNVLLREALYADTAKNGLKVHHYAGTALAAATPIAMLSKPGLILKATDLVLAVAIPAHMHCTLNMLITDYLPSGARVPTRYGLLGATGMTFLGLMKLNFTGPGITEQIRGLWRRPNKSPAPAKKGAAQEPAKIPAEPEPVKKA